MDDVNRNVIVDQPRDLLMDKTIMFHNHCDLFKRISNVLINGKDLNSRHLGFVEQLNSNRSFYHPRVRKGNDSVNNICLIKSGILLPD